MPNIYWTYQTWRNHKDTRFRSRFTQFSGAGPFGPCPSCPSRGESLCKATRGGNEDHVCRDDRHGEDTFMGAGVAQWRMLFAADHGLKRMEETGINSHNAIYPIVNLLHQSLYSIAL